MDSLVFSLQLGNKRLVNPVVKDERLHVRCAEHADILALLLLICHVIDGAVPGLFLFFVFCVRGSFFVLLLRDDLGLYCVSVLIGRVLALLGLRVCLIDLEGLGKCEIFPVQILEEDIIRHLLAEFVVPEASVLDKRADVIPVFVVVFLVCPAHAGELVRHLLRDVVGDLRGKAVILQRASRYVQRQIGAVDDAL